MYLSMPNLPLFSGSHTIPVLFWYFVNKLTFMLSMFYDVKAFGHYPFILHLSRLKGLKIFSSPGSHPLLHCNCPSRPFLKNFLGSGRWHHRPHAHFEVQTWHSYLYLFLKYLSCVLQEGQEMLMIITSLELRFSEKVFTNTSHYCSI